MTDIVERLRYSTRPPYADDSMLVEAADEIERLRRAVDAGIKAGWHALRTERGELLQAHTALVARLHDVTTMLEVERARIADAPVVKRNQLRSGIVPGDYAVPHDWNPEGKRVALVVVE
jgi:hypothetical protein